MKTTEHGIEESRDVENVYHMRLMALLQELVRERVTRARRVCWRSTSGRWPRVRRPACCPGGRATRWRGRCRRASALLQLFSGSETTGWRSG